MKRDVSTVNVPKPEPVTLNTKEQALLRRITFDYTKFHEREIVASSCSAAAALARSLLERRAIPQLRLRYFKDPRLNVGGRNKSRKQVFERNGTKGDAIFRHSRFLKYLKYFIFGPDLPSEMVARFRQILVDDVGTSGTVLDDLSRYARTETRRVLSEQRPERASPRPPRGELGWRHR